MNRPKDDAVTREPVETPVGYSPWLAELKNRIREARLRASLAVNAKLIELYWRIGRDILERQERDGWGAKVVDRLARDLRAEFPEMRGFSRANLLYMLRSPRLGPTPNLSNGSLDNCPGVRTSSC